MIRIDVESFKQCFKEKEGVVINTFHGVKGEEYERQSFDETSQPYKRCI